MIPGPGHFWPQGYNFLNNLDRGPLGDAKYQISRARLSTFRLYDLDMQWTRTIGTILVEGHTRIICVKLFQNWARGLGGVVV